MATRQEIQVAQDLIKFSNIMNDMLDVMSYVAKEIDATGGDKLQKTEGPPGALTQRDYTLEEMQETLRRMSQGVSGYEIMISAFLTSVNLDIPTNGLSAIGVSLTDIQNDVSSMKAVANHVYANALASTTKEGLAKDIGEYIDTNVPRLPLVRRVLPI